MENININFEETNDNVMNILKKWFDISDIQRKQKNKKGLIKSFRIK